MGSIERAVLYRAKSVAVNHSSVSITQLTDTVVDTKLFSFRLRKT